MLKAKIGVVVLAAAFSGGFAPKAEAFYQPTTPCNASNVGQFEFTEMGSRKFEWYCDGSQWSLYMQYQCNEWGLNCIPL